MKMNSYELSRAWFDFAFDNPSKITPSHGILYFFCIEHCNRLGWKKEFGLPTTMAKEAIGIRSYNTYINTLNDLVKWGFIILIEKSKNQYSSNIVALSNFNKAHNKALDKAMSKHYTKQSESTIQSISSIDKQLNNEQITIEQETSSFILEPLEIIQRLKENEYQIMEYAMKTFKFSESQYYQLCEIFVGEKTAGENELDKEYSEVIKQFKSWIKYHNEKLTKLLNQKDGTERKIGRHSVSDVQRFLNGG